MKSLKRKVIMSAVVLVFALIATIGSTYAWFTVSTVVTVSGVELDVQSDESLLILVDDSYTLTAGEDYVENAANYSISVTNTDITGTTKYANLGDWTLGTVTAGYGNTDGSNLTYTGLNDGGTPLVTTLRTMDLDDKTHSAATSNSGGVYISIDFWLLSQSATDEDVVLQDLEFATTAGNTTGQDNVINSLRLMTESDGEDDLIFSTNPDYAFEFLLGDPGYDGSNAWENVLDDTPTTGVQDVLLADHALFFDSGAVGDGTDTANIDDSDITQSSVVVTLASNTPTKVTVNIYIEGWDSDADTDILNATFTVSFKFALQDTAA